MKYSVIVLLEETRPNFSGFINDLHNIFTETRENFEIVIIANGKKDFLIKEMKKVSLNSDCIEAFALNKKASQAVCLNAGFKECSGEIIVVCGSYKQITNQSFLKLLHSFEDSIDIISPWRYKRVDPRINQIQSRIFNFLVNKITRSNLSDLSCTVKVFKRKVLEEVKIYGNMYRFLPILAIKKGFSNKQVECEHFQEFGKTGFYQPRMYLARLIDILILYFITRFSRTPLRFFSAIGATFFIFGLLITLYIFMQKIVSGIPIGERYLLLLGILFMILGAQAASTGLLGEIITFTNGRIQKQYSVEKEV